MIGGGRGGGREKHNNENNRRNLNGKKREEKEMLALSLSRQYIVGIFYAFKQKVEFCLNHIIVNNVLACFSLLFSAISKKGETLKQNCIDEWINI